MNDKELTEAEVRRYVTELKTDSDLFLQEYEKMLLSFKCMPLAERCLCWCKLNLYTWPDNPDFPWKKPEGWDTATLEARYKIMNRVWTEVNLSGIRGKTLDRIWNDYSALIATEEVCRDQ